MIAFATIFICVVKKDFSITREDWEELLKRFSATDKKEGWYCVYSEGLRSKRAVESVLCANAQYLTFSLDFHAKIIFRLRLCYHIIRNPSQDELTSLVIRFAIWNRPFSVFNSSRRPRMFSFRIWDVLSLCRCCLVQADTPAIICWYLRWIA